MTPLRSDKKLLRFIEHAGVKIDLLRTNSDYVKEIKGDPELMKIYDDAVQICIKKRYKLNSKELNALGHSLPFFNAKILVGYARTCSLYPDCQPTLKFVTSNPRRLALCQLGLKMYLSMHEQESMRNIAARIGLNERYLLKYVFEYCPYYLFVPNYKIKCLQEEKANHVMSLNDASRGRTKLKRNWKLERAVRYLKEDDKSIFEAAIRCGMKCERLVKLLNENYSSDPIIQRKIIDCEGMAGIQRIMYPVTINAASMKSNSNGNGNSKRTGIKMERSEFNKFKLMFSNAKFKDQGLFYDMAMKSVKCTLCKLYIGTSNLAKHIKTANHVRAFNEAAPKDNILPGEVSWPAQSSPGPSTSRNKDVSPRPSTSAASAHLGGFNIKSEPNTPPPPMLINPYVQESAMPQSQPRLLPKLASSQQHQPRLRPRPPPPVNVPPPDPEPQQVCLRWNSFQSNMTTMFPNLLTNEKFVDVTLACEGRSVKAHKVVLSSCSLYLDRLLTENPCKHPIILMPRDMRFWELKALVDFMYSGEITVEHEQLSSLLAAAELLEVKGLAGPTGSNNHHASEPESLLEEPERNVSPPPPTSPRPPKRRRVALSPPPPVRRAPVAPSPPTLPNSPAVSITRLTAKSKSNSLASRDSTPRVQSPGIEITPVVTFEEIKMEPVDISDESLEQNDATFEDMDTLADKDFDDVDDDSEAKEDDVGGASETVEQNDPGPVLENGTSDLATSSDFPEDMATDFNGTDAATDLNYTAADFGLTTEQPDDPPDESEAIQESESAEIS